MPITVSVHQLVVVALLVPFLALSAGLIALSFGIAWRQRNWKR